MNNDLSYEEVSQRRMSVCKRRTIYRSRANEFPQRVHDDIYDGSHVRLERFESLSGEIHNMYDASMCSERLYITC